MMTGGNTSRSRKKLSVQVIAMRTPTQVSVRSSSRLSESQTALASGA